MDQRYADERIAETWSNRNKLSLWLKLELAVIEARERLGYFPVKTLQRIKECMEKNPIDIDWWKNRDEDIRHDLNAFLDERLRFIPQDLQEYFHKKITSYDTEEAPFIIMIKQSLRVIWPLLENIEEVLKKNALKYRYVIMNGRTHGQEAEMQSLGKRFLTWIQELRLGRFALEEAAERLIYSKISGAIGNYGSIDPKVEKTALAILGLEPYYGATQIMPREIYLPVANALSQIVGTLNKIALDIRLGARSGRPIFHEPFAKKQKGSSAMPHKKNTITTEQIEGMDRMARHYASMIRENIQTWEERAIEQSCVERVAWPDIFHVAAHSLKRMAKVIEGLVVYPDNMLKEIVESRGCYASSEVKEFLKESGIPHEMAYRIVQLAAFNVFAPDIWAVKRRTELSESHEEALKVLGEAKINLRDNANAIISIQMAILNAGLWPMPDQLEATAEDVACWNEELKKLFLDPKKVEEFNELFNPRYLLKNEAFLYGQILSE